VSGAWGGGGPWGLGGWGGGGGAALYVAGAYAVSNRTIRVILSTAPLAASPYGVGDALNPETWVVTRLDTDAVLTVLQTASDGGTAWDLTFLLPLPQFAIVVKVDAGALLDAGGGAILPPSVAECPGAAYDQVSTPAAALASRGLG